MLKTMNRGSQLVHCGGSANNNNNNSSCYQIHPQTMSSFVDPRASDRQLDQWKNALEMQAHCQGHPAYQVQPPCPVQPAYRFPATAADLFKMSVFSDQDAEQNFGAEMESRRDSCNKLVRSESVQTSCSSSSSSTTSSGQAPSKGERYKTELCRPYENSGSCKYGTKCQFAHGFEELRGMPRHPKYKTDKCRTFYTTGLCPYGQRCHFMHAAPQGSGRMELTENFSEIPAVFGETRGVAMPRNSTDAQLSFSPSTAEYAMWSHEREILLLQQQLQQQSLRVADVQQHPQPITNLIMNNTSQLQYNNNNSNNCPNRNFAAMSSVQVPEQHQMAAYHPSASLYHSTDRQLPETTSGPSNQIEISELVAALASLLASNSAAANESALSPSYFENPSSSISPPPHIYPSDSLGSTAVSSPTKSCGFSSDSGESNNSSPTTELYNNIFACHESKTQESFANVWENRSCFADAVWSTGATRTNWSPFNSIFS